MNASWRSCLGLLLILGSWGFDVSAADKPNVLVIITDDQGYGDLGCHGNPKIITPNLDAFARQSVQMRHFYVSPVCSPTRSSLMTGRYNYRTGIVDTFAGRSMMHPDETSIAKVLAGAGYRTGIFGKWHLGDNYPLRPQEQGFKECLVLKGGGLGQNSDLPGGSSYFDPILLHNGKPEKQKGYVSNVLTDATIAFITTPSDKPFFTYLAFNCPHTPLEVSDEDLKPYKDMKLGLDQFPKVGYPIAKKYSEETTARVYAMETNIDTNVGRIFAALAKNKLADNTIVLFLCDNGPQQPRFNAGFRGLKTTVYEGGVRVPFYARWPGQFPRNKKSDVVAAHIDIFPTLLDACGVAVPNGLKIDGISLLPALKGEDFKPAERTIYLQWHRGEVPEMGRGCMARGPRFKIAQPLGLQEGKAKLGDFELYDILNDPYEQTNLAAERPEILAHMRKGYEAWFADVKKEREFQPPRIILGSTKENPSLLTRQDWRGPNTTGAAGKADGFWEISIDRPGKYRVTVFANPAKAERVAHVRLGASMGEAALAGDKAIVDNLVWKKGDGRLEAWIVDGKERYGAKYLEVERVGD
jgi:arylsulfatase A-like enzyme